MLMNSYKLIQNLTFISAKRVLNYSHCIKLKDISTCLGFTKFHTHEDNSHILMRIWRVLVNLMYNMTE